MLSDFASVDSIIRASYETLSGPAGQPRDWNRFRALYYPGARLMPVVSGTSPHVRLLDVEGYIQRVDPIFKTENFWEIETRREEKTIGRMAHVLSDYESFRDPKAEPFDRGTNSIQLFYDENRWWIVNIMWNTPRSA